MNAVRSERARGIGSKLLLAAVASSGRYTSPLVAPKSFSGHTESMSMRVVDAVPFGICSIVLSLQLTGFMTKAAKFRYASKKQVPASPPSCEDSCLDEAERHAERLKKGDKKTECPPVAELAETMKQWVRASRAEQNRIEWFPVAMLLMGMVHFFAHWTLGVVFTAAYYYASSSYFHGALKGGSGRMPGFKLHIRILIAMIAVIGLGMAHAVALEFFQFDTLAVVGVKGVIEGYTAAVSAFLREQLSAVVPAAKNVEL